MIASAIVDEFSALGGCSYVVLDPGDLVAARGALRGADAVVTFEQALGEPRLVEDTDLVVLLREGDQGDQAKARRLRSALGRATHSFQAVEIPDWSESTPLADWLTRRPAIIETPGAFGAWLSGLGDSLDVPLGESDLPATAPPWPAPLREEALYGLAGDIVRDVAPQTEADPAGLLVTLLVGMGNALGREPYARVGSTQHHMNTNCVLVGDTSAARKGTSLAECRPAWAMADADWSAARIVGGLSTGEGLIHAVRDRVIGHDEEGKESIIDPGVDDKRLLVVEGEFARVLAVQSRQGSTLSAVLRDAWDGQTLRTLTRRDGLVSTAPHISVLGHITLAELQACLSRSDTFNGFANRFLWVCVRRSKLLPFGGQVSSEQRELWGTRLGEAFACWRPASEAPRDDDGPIDWHSETRALWESAYPLLTAPRPGAWGGATSRAEAHTLRLAALYAVLDRTTTMRPEHLRAALAVWDYCCESARTIFGERLGNPTAEKILAALRVASPGGLSRTEIREDVLQRNVPASEIAAALGVLPQAGAARSTKTRTAGRPVETWFASTLNAINAFNAK